MSADRMMVGAGMGYATFHESAFTGWPALFLLESSGRRTSPRGRLPAPMATRDALHTIRRICQLGRMAELQCFHVAIPPVKPAV